MRNDLNSKLLIENSFQHPLFDDYPDPVFTLDLEGNFLSANKALIDLAECTKEELFNLTFAPFIIAEDLEMASNYFHKTVIGEIQNFNTRVISAKGTIRNFNITNLPIVINNEVIGVHVIAKDTTMLLENKRQIEIYNNRISSILESITDCFFALDKEWTVTYWNKEAERLLKMPRKDILGKNLWEVYQNAIPLKFFSEYHKAVAERVSVCFDEYFPPFDIWIEVSAFPSEEGLSVYFKDITARKISERALAASEQRFKALVQDGSDLVAILDLTGNYKYVSPTSMSILGTEADYYIGKNAFDFIHIDDQENVLHHFNLLKEQKRVKIPPYRFKIENEHYHWIETIVTNMMDDPTVAGIVANSRDVTQRIENEIKIEESIERFNTVSKATNEAIWDWDIVTGNIIWNRGIKGIFGYNHIAYNRDWWHSRVHPDDVKGIVTKIQSLIKHKKSRLKVEYRFRCADGTYKYVLDRSFLLFNKTEEPLKMIGSMQDITDSVNYTEAIEKQNQRLREIAFTQSHHVRAPLARIIGLSKLLFDSNEKEETKECLKHLISSADELDRVIKDIVEKAENI